MTADFSKSINAVKRSDMEKLDKMPNLEPLMGVALQEKYAILKMITNHRVIVALSEGGACYANFDRRGFWILNDIDGLIPKEED